MQTLRIPQPTPRLLPRRTKVYVSSLLTFGLLRTYHTQSGGLCMLSTVNGWIKRWGGFLGLLCGSGVVFAAFQVASNFAATNAQLAIYGPSIQKVPGVESSVSQIQAQISNLPAIQANTDKIPTIDKKVAVLGSSIDRSVIPALNEVRKERSLPDVPPVRIEDVRALLREQKQQLEGLITQSSQQQKSALTDLSTDVWRIGDPILQPKVESLSAKWQQTLSAAWSAEARRQEVVNSGHPPGQSFTGGAVLLPPKPEIKAQIRDGVIVVEGKVPAEATKEEIGKSFLALRPKNVVNQLTVAKD